MPPHDSDVQPGSRSTALEGLEAGLKTLEHEIYGKVLKGEFTVKKFQTGGDEKGSSINNVETIISPSTKNTGFLSLAPE